MAVKVNLACMKRKIGTPFHERVSIKKKTTTEKQMTFFFFFLVSSNIIVQDFTTRMIMYITFERDFYAIQA